jgi:thiamine kinase-like enzyme
MKLGRGVNVLRSRARSLREERWLVERLRKSGTAHGAIKVERISGGLSNHNFAVHTQSHTYFSRICQERRLLGIDRHNEIVCHQAASDRALAPEVVHHEESLLVTRYIEGRTLGAVDVRNPAIMSKLAALLCRLHEGWDLLTGEVLYFCPFQTVRTYAATARRLGATLPADIDGLLEDVRGLAGQVAPFRPVLCHNDLMPGNLIDDGSRLWLVDWEYAGAGHPLFDLANAAANAGFSDQDDHALLESYGGHFSLRTLAEFRVFKAISFLRESLWSTVQSVASDIEFDYRGYASDNLLTYRAARDSIPRLSFDKLTKPSLE